MNRLSPSTGAEISPSDNLKASIRRLKELTHALSNLVGLTMNHLELCAKDMAGASGQVRENFMAAEKLSTMATDHLKCLMNEVSFLTAITNGHDGDKNDAHVG
jgi:hypothetical protein